MTGSKQFINLAIAVIEMEAAAVSALKDRVNQDFVKACDILLACEGRIIVTGIGKSGHIGSKIAATLASTGSPAFFVHPGEAHHGDMGMITPQDVLLAISYSGQTTEIMTMLPILKRLGVPMITITGNPNSPLALASSVILNVHVAKEACPLGLAPTSSTTASLVMGDAIAIALLDAKGFSADDFALSHPGGNLGKRLLLKVGDLMYSGDKVPKVSPQTKFMEALIEMTQKKLGMTTVVDEQNRLLGIYTDGDIRRTISNHQDCTQLMIQEVMTVTTKTIPANHLAVDALRIMESYKITALVVLDEVDKVVGVIHLHDIIQAGV